MTRLRVPIGMQTPRKLRERDCYYVDKTAYIERLLDEGTRYFLSRPRRFGKSLFLDTLKELFEGNESLFEGLHIHDCHDWSVRHLVVRLDSAGGHFGELGSIPRLLREHLVRVAHERRHRRREVQQSLPAGHSPAHRLTHLSLRVQVRGAAAPSGSVLARPRERGYADKYRNTARRSN